MRISVFGLGYVGAVCVGALASRGHKIIGVDVSTTKIDLINQGLSPIVEPGLGELLADGVKKGLISGTLHVTNAVHDSDLSMICVGTPSKRNGDLDLSYIEYVCEEIGLALREKSERHTVVIRSTVLPGTVSNVVQPILEKFSGKKAGVDFGLAINPEFLRESTAIKDYNFPPITVIGEYDTASGDVLHELYCDLPAKIIRKPISIAEMIKYTCNVWHATKVTFANEIGSLCKALGVDGRDVMDVVCQDEKLNISAYYLRPGFAFGGSCLPKDVRALTYRASQLDVKHPMLAAIMDSNSYQIERSYEIIDAFKMKKIGMLGLSFKAGTDDLRESPLVTLAEMLIGRGFQLKIFDRSVEYARIHGANKDYINNHIPHISALLTSDLHDVIDSSDVIVLGNKDELFESVVDTLPEGKKVLDLVGFMKSTSTETLEGICW
ncbi:MAG TPA: UDP-glucose/GDP-mannose dehydrogenase family protein [Cellvibrio sp.]|nr:UDP-glucose/GDP-mannose dehydrogenase family protein [Cellvibrio sp.]